MDDNNANRDPKDQNAAENNAGKTQSKFFDSIQLCHRLYPAIAPRADLAADLSRNAAKRSF